MKRRRRPQSSGGLCRLQAIALIGVAILFGTAGIAAARTTGSNSKIAPRSAKSPIVIAGICDFTGAETSPEPCEVSKAYFADLDKHGGINGHKVEYSSYDEGYSATTAAQDGAQIVYTLKAMAIVGDESYFACTENAALYAQNDIADLGGPEADTGCWKSAFIRPMNAGGNVLLAAYINFFVVTQHLKRVCVLVSSSSPASYADDLNVIKVEQKLTGVKAIAIPYANGTPVTPIVSDAISQNCQAFASSSLQSTEEAILRAFYAEKAELPRGMKLLSGFVAATMPSDLGAAGNDVYALDGQVLYTADNTPTLRGYHALINQIGLPADSPSLYGYLTDTIFTEIVKNMKGPINRKTLTRAIRGFKNLSAGGIEGGLLSWNSVDTDSRILQIRDSPKGYQWFNVYHHWIPTALKGVDLRSVETGIPLS